MSLSKEIERYKAWLEDNPVEEATDEEGAWIGFYCPCCGAVADTEEEAYECCMPDVQDIDCYNYHNKRD